MKGDVKSMRYLALKFKMNYPMPIWSEVGRLMGDDFDYYLTDNGYIIEKEKTPELMKLEYDRTKEMRNLCVKKIGSAYGCNQVSLVKEQIKNHHTVLFAGFSLEEIQRLRTPNMFIVCMEDGLPFPKCNLLDEINFTKTYVDVPYCRVFKSNQLNLKKYVNNKTFIVKQEHFNLGGNKYE